MSVKITGSGSYVPDLIRKNDDFLANTFYDEKGNIFPKSNDEIVEKFEKITGIIERRYASKEIDSSDMAAEAAQLALDDAALSKEMLDAIIVAHNTGCLAYGSKSPNLLPSVASQIKAKLHVQNPDCIAFDIIFGCPGWIQGIIQANAMILAKNAKRCLIIGSDTLSRMLDETDRDSMIFADGAGAIVIEENEEPGGILSYGSKTYTSEDRSNLIYTGNANKLCNSTGGYIKMYGRKVYEFALKTVPGAMKDCLDKAGVEITELKKIFIHQANKKMDDTIVNRFYKLFNQSTPEHIMPMTIEKFGNSSVATIPTMLDLVRKTGYQGHRLHSGDVILMTSVGAGMNINSICYQV